MDIQSNTLIEDEELEFELSQVGVKDLECANINHQDKDSVLSLIKEIDKKNKLKTIAPLIFLTIMLYFIISRANSTKQIPDINLFLFIVICSIPVLLPFQIMHFFEKNVCNEAENGTIAYKKAQYGTLMNKYSLSYNYNSKRYVLSVKFPNGSCLSGVECNEETYHKISQGDSVLVISFDNKNVYVLGSNNRIQP